MLTASISAVVGLIQEWICCWSTHSEHQTSPGMALHCSDLNLLSVCRRRRKVPFGVVCRRVPFPSATDAEGYLSRQRPMLKCLCQFDVLGVRLCWTDGCIFSGKTVEFPRAYSLTAEHFWGLICSRSLKDSSVIGIIRANRMWRRRLHPLF